MKNSQSLNVNIANVTDNLADSFVAVERSTKPLNDKNSTKHFTWNDMSFSFELTTEICIYIHAALISSVFIIGLMR